MRKILCIDDTPIVLKTLEIFLKNEYDVTLCEKSPKGLALALTGDYPVIVTDIRMPEMSGLEIVEELAKAQVPCQCILLTSHSLSSFDSDVEKSPLFFKYVQKPVKKQDIVSAIEEAFEDLSQ